MATFVVQAFRGCPSPFHCLEFVGELWLRPLLVSDAILPSALSSSPVLPLLSLALLLALVLQLVKYP